MLQGYRGTSCQYGMLTFTQAGFLADTAERRVLPLTEETTPEPQRLQRCQSSAVTSESKHWPFFMVHFEPHHTNKEISHSHVCHVFHRSVSSTYNLESLRAKRAAGREVPSTTIQPSHVHPHSHTGAGTLTFQPAELLLSPLSLK